jgi:hypothetical protein
MCRVTRRIDLLQNATPYADSAKRPFPAVVCQISYLTWQSKRPKSFLDISRKKAGIKLDFSEKA